MGVQKDGESFMICSYCGKTRKSVNSKIPGSEIKGLRKLADYIEAYQRQKG